MADILVDSYTRNRTLALVGGIGMLGLGALLWLTAPADVLAPDFLSAHDERVIWAKGFAASGLLAFVLALASIRVAHRPVAADRLAALGWTVVCLAAAGACVVYAAMYLG